MRIVYLITRSDSIGGYHVHVRDLSRALRARGDDPIVVMGQRGPFADELRELGIPFYLIRHLDRAIRPWRDAAALFEIRATLAHLRPDLLSTHSSKTGWLGRLIGPSLGIPVITTAHGWSFTVGVPPLAAHLYRWAERLTLHRAARIITVSEFDRQTALRYRVASADRLITVHNGMPDIPPALRARERNASAPLRLTMVARFEPQKDHATLLHALAGLRDHAWELDLVGDGPKRPAVEELAQRLGISGRVHFLGARRDVAERLAEAHVFVLTSLWEGFPRTILEAMRAGLPVVASDVGGVREAVTEGETGFVVPRRDVAAVRNRIAQLLTDPALGARLGARGRQDYERHFTLEHMLSSTLTIYRDVVPGGRPQRARSLATPGLAPSLATLDGDDELHADHLEGSLPRHD